MSGFLFTEVIGILRKGSFTQAIFVAQLNTICVALKLQLQNRACKPAAILVQFIAAV